MKKMKNIFKAVLMTVVLGASTMFTSCTDFLTIYPTNSTIHENYWQTADDVNGMLASSYLQLLSNDAVSRMIVWGELRADNMNVRNNASNTYKYIVEANIKEDNSYCNWAIFYKAINYANMVIEFAPEVTERDPDFTEGDLKIVLGEMYALRALAHFYLVRTFRDIPLSYKASLNDAELIDYPQVHPMVALDSIMNDLDRAGKLVMASGTFPNKFGTYNYGRITSNAVNAMKADVNLWRAAFAKYYEGADSVMMLTPDEYYEMAIGNCDAVIDAMNADMAEYYENHGSTTDKANVGPGTKNPYYLAQDATVGSTGMTANKVSASYNAIFGDNKNYNTQGKAMHGEVIFELIYEDDKNTNKAVHDLYGSSGGNGQLCVARPFILDDALFEESDLRFYSSTSAEELGGGSDGNSSSSASANEIAICKYVMENSPGSAGNKRQEEEVNNVTGINANWIIYRKTDVMLMKAEALVYKSTASDDDITAAYQLAKAVNDRSVLAPADTLIRGDYPERENIAQLVLDERARELAFEGKRWYDLVRVALRDKSTDNIRFVANKIEGGGASAVQKKMMNMNTLFFPIAESELNVNPLLVQNPAYETSSSVEQN